MTGMLPYRLKPNSPAIFRRDCRSSSLAGILRCRQIVQREGGHGAVKGGDERLFLGSGQFGKIGAAPAALPGRQECPAGERPDAVRLAGAIRTEQRTAAGFAPVAPQVILQGSNTGQAAA